MNFSINRALELIIGVMTLGFVTLVVVGGPVDEFLNQVEEEVDERTTSNPRVEIDSRSELAGIAKLSMDRAAECDSVRAHQYPDLSETRLGSNPNCRLGLPGEGITRDYTRPTNPTGPGDDVEGIDSRIRFNITQDMTLRTDRRYGSPVDADGTWFEDSGVGGTDGSQGKFSVTGVSDMEFSETITQTCNALVEQGVEGSKYSSSRFEGTGLLDDASAATYGYIVTFSTDSANRYQTSGKHNLIPETPQYGKTNGAYCMTALTGTTSSSLLGVFANTGSHSAVMGLQKINAPGDPDGHTKVKLCEGDKGYVQVNKRRPFKTAEAEDTGENIRITSLFGYIQVTESSGSCTVD